MPRFGDGVELERHAAVVVLALRALEDVVVAAIIEEAVALVDLCGYQIYGAFVLGQAG